MVFARLSINRRLYSLMLCGVLIGGTCSLANAEENAEHVELHMRNGAIITGELISSDENKLTVKSSSVSKSGKVITATMPYNRSDIAEVFKLANPEEQYREKEAAAQSAKDHLALALWCREKAFADYAIKHAKRTVELDASQEVAVKMLSDVDLAYVDGKWVKESEALLAQGKVRYRGEVMSIAEAHAREATVKKIAERTEAEKAAEEKSRSLTYINEQISNLKSRLIKITGELQQAQNDLARAESLGQKVMAAKLSVEAAQKKLDEARFNNQQIPNTGGQNNSYNIPALTQAVENQQKALIAARDEARNAPTLSALARGKIMALSKEQKSAENKLEDLEAKQKRLEAE